MTTIIILNGMETGFYYFEFEQTHLFILFAYSKEQVSSLNVVKRSWLGAAALLQGTPR